MTMTLKDIRNVLRQAEKESAPTIWPGDAGDMADAIDAHITQSAQSCQHDWAEGYGVPAYCNHCGKTRDSQLAQSVNVEKIREVIAELRDYDEADATGLGEWADKLTAALQEKGNG